MADTSCPCGSTTAFADCCQPIIEGRCTAASAEALMRSRFTAYTLGDSQYLLASWHPSTRPESITLDQNQHWTRLKISDVSHDIVEFTAVFKQAGKAHKLHERSRFVQQDARWYYLDAEDSQTVG